MGTCTSVLHASALIAPHLCLIQTTGSAMGDSVAQKWLSLPLWLSGGHLQAKA
jgi:hypothetical protein